MVQFFSLSKACSDFGLSEKRVDILLLFERVGVVAVKHV